MDEDFKKALDRIKELEAENDQLRAKCEAYERGLLEISGMTYTLDTVGQAAVILNKAEALLTADSAETEPMTFAGMTVRINHGMPSDEAQIVDGSTMKVLGVIKLDDGADSAENDNE